MLKRVFFKACRRETVLHTSRARLLLILMRVLSKASDVAGRYVSVALADVAQAGLGLSEL